MLARTAKCVRKDFSSSLNLLIASSLQSYFYFNFLNKPCLVSLYSGLFYCEMCENANNRVRVRGIKLLLHERKLNPHCECSPGLQQPFTSFWRAHRKLIFIRTAHIFLCLCNFLPNEWIFNLGGTSVAVASRLAGKAEKNNKN